MDIPKIHSLLSYAAAINKQYEKITTITGENFNVFKILGLSTNEVRTHSAFIGELLNPNGSHGQKEIFLQLFCKQMGVEGFECEQATSQIEKHVGFISEDYSEGGYIDIIVTNKKEDYAIVIENKIYAGDQRNQLQRYYNYANKFIKHKLFYLTLDGKDASKGSKGDISDEGIIKISYKEHILAWLEKCKEKAVNHPLLRETITQYIHLIKHLTHQTLSNDMSNELIALIANNKDYYNSIDDLNDAYGKFKLNVKAKFWESFYKKMPNDTIDTLDDLEFKYHTDEDGDGFYYGFSIKKNGNTVLGNSDESERYALLLKKINPKFNANSGHIGWTYSQYFKFILEDKETTFKLNDDAFLNDFTDRLAAELQNYIQLFKAELEVIKSSISLNSN